ncbi:hypothetical protein PVAP13_3KG573200 [Panicum virgatum]|uniref:Uncharacterized protein n=1 Tax=Panicum virgatum TaxID=38727 RepID=A0A8T0VCU6_PANVG|nr:hypothetical protein PVAP13_3KG573200 [Panicum virgatum]
MVLAAESLVGGDAADAPAAAYGYGWAGVWSTLASLLFLWSMVQDHLPFQLQDHLAALARRILAAVSPYVTITIDEHAADSFARSEAYLSATCAARAARLRADLPDGSDRVSGQPRRRRPRRARLCWRKTKTLRRANVIAWNPREEERRAYRLTFHRRHRALVEAAYLPHVLAEGRAATVRNRQRRLFTNNTSADWGAAGAEDGPRVWSHVKLEHPSTFATLAMDPARKREIAWKRGYLLFGPPGTGESTMIAAMANFLDYDVYDLELAKVKSNTELRRLFIETTGKSIIVIEDIDCSIDLPGKRKKSNNKNDKKMPWDDNDGDDKDGKVRRLLEEVSMTPADVAENLMPRSKKKDVDACLGKLVKALQEARCVT